MISGFFRQIFFLPLYNALVWLSSVLPGSDIGLAIIVLTLLVRLVLFPLQHRMSKTQRLLKRLEPRLNELKTKYADNKSEQAKQLMELYREHGVNPFAGFLLLLIQLPILLALYWVFRDSFILNPDWVYSFITPPSVSGTHLLGWLDITTRSWPLALGVGLTQFIQMHLVMPAIQASQPVTTPGKSFAADLQRSMSFQMRYFMPLMVTFIALSLPAAIPLYWITSNLFAIGHELFITRRFRESHGESVPRVVDHND